jgi:Domain of unknown function (DUF4178)
VSVVCGNCGAVLDAQDPDARLIARYEQERLTPPIPLGTRGKLGTETFEVIGYVVRRSVGDDVFSWAEYLLHSPTLGFRWLVEYHGHWTLTRAAPGVPTIHGRRATYLGETYAHFATATAEVAAVVGELPWQARVGERVVVDDWIRPPKILSSERSSEETTWSTGEYVDGAALWKAFGLPGAPPERLGVGGNQPSPYAGRGAVFAQLMLGFIAAAVLIYLLFLMLAQQRLVLDWSGEFRTPSPESTTVVSDPFDVTGRTSNLRVDISTTVANNWVYFNLVLVNDVTGVAKSFGREVGLYSGRDSDGYWSEGSNWDRVYLPSVPAGTYVLVVEPEGPPQHIGWRVQLTRDVPRPLWLWLAVGLLVLPPLFAWLRKLSFEQRRWREGDHAPSGAGTDDD